MQQGKDARALSSSHNQEATAYKLASILGEYRIEGDTAEARDAPAGTERIVLAEDDPGVRRATLLILEDLGYQVEAYASGSEALAALESDDRPVELLLTDFDMPGLTGYELARRLRALKPDAKVLLTSGSAEETITRGEKPDDWPPFIPKPFTYHSLGRKLRDVLDVTEAAV
jgi:CheY-like chemotaxis protein